MKCRIVKKDGFYYAQAKKGFIFKKWTCIVKFSYSFSLFDSYENSCITFDEAYKCLIEYHNWVRTSSKIEVVQEFNIRYILK